MRPEPLELNAIRSLVINDFVADENGKQISVTLRRRTPEPAKGFRTLQPSVLPDGPPARLPSVLPPAGDLQLTISIMDLIGNGRCGSVYSTSLPHLQDRATSNPPCDNPLPILSYLPELVVKVADEAHVDDLASEASMYDEMEVLQGVAIPRCYGWFEGELGPLTMAPAANPSKCEPETKIAQRRNVPTRLSILVLERVGEHLPLGERIPDRSDIWEVFSDLSQLGINQPDMRYSNILTSPTSLVSQVPSSPSTISLPGKICPYHHRTHKYRIIDFDRARKTDWTLKQHYYQQVGTLGRLLEMMEMNIILEPWEY
ncbi:hypothetical protein GALMADRAFT_246561 [Galerina marginata CBS 339.88]|uniref:Protein kinase domain-containing protein n=1 Tax=Galerina marginata (strain CBS 339.88) TaxID=685588 RepID=A0A067T230_GALM3|nr:hypothetical protein GALMADRAFT_246561 [Galerina marginata CBS 339.88]